jgi:hypothetical protein
MRAESLSDFGGETERKRGRAEFAPMAERKEEPGGLKPSAQMIPIALSLAISLATASSPALV